MKLANRGLDKSRLLQDTRVYAAKTDSAAVNTGPEEEARLRKIQSISRFFGSGIWQGDLAQMREDRSRGLRSRK